MIKVDASSRENREVNDLGDRIVVKFLSKLYFTGLHIIKSSYFLSTCLFNEIFSKVNLIKLVNNISEYYNTHRDTYISKININQSFIFIRF